MDIEASRMAGGEMMAKKKLKTLSHDGTSLEGNAPSWPEEDWIERIRACKMLLSIHGFLSPGESQKIELKIQKCHQINETKGGK